MYDSYFEWKKSTSFEAASLDSHYCSFCRKLNEGHSDMETDEEKRDFREWWFDEAPCFVWENDSLKNLVDEEEK